ncbi:hypothetical protein [Maritalea sp.]|uniref:hypothetical protein n=1 Tax=Maritalea sp. TaxID=2003361 RepID=UPI003EF69F7C
MQRSPIEQLAALSSNRKASESPAVSDVEIEIDSEEIALVQKDLAIERILTALNTVVTSAAPVIKQAAISKDAIEHLWEWAQRDLDPDVVANLNQALGSGAIPTDYELEKHLSEIINLVEPLYVKCNSDDELQRRLSIQMGGAEVYEVVPTILLAFNYVGYIQSGATFGRELSSFDDPEALKYALEQIDFPSTDIKKLWCLSFVAGVARPDILAATIAKLCFANTEEAFKKTGYSEFLDALVLEAQKQIEIIEQQAGLFKDVDLMCKAIDRFHHIARGLHLHLDLPKSAKWNLLLEGFTKRGAVALHSRFSDVLANMKNVLRPTKGETSAAINPADVLQAYNGLYILSATRSARESLAVNAMVEKNWKDVGYALENLIDRVFEHYKRVGANDKVTRTRVEVLIKFCAIRFGLDYATTLAKHKSNIERRSQVQKSNS